MNLTPQQKLEILCAYLPHGLSMSGCQSKLSPYMVDRFIDGDFDAQPILRHPDDMTDQELQKLADITDGLDTMLGVTWQKYLISLETSQQALNYLHSLHIDTFGAIEAKWAVRKETN